MCYPCAKLIIDVLNRYKPIAVLHFAAYADVSESMLHPEKYFQNNVIESLKFIDALIEVGMSNLIFSSSLNPLRTKLQISEVFHL